MGSKKKAVDHIDKLMRNEISDFIEITEILMAHNRERRHRLIQMIKLLMIDDIEETHYDGGGPGAGDRLA